MKRLDHQERWNRWFESDLPWAFLVLASLAALILRSQYISHDVVAADALLAPSATVESSLERPFDYQRVRP